MELIKDNLRLHKVSRIFLTSLSKTLLLIVGFIIFASFILPQPAQAHSQLSDSSPKPDEQLSSSPEKITLTFKAGITPNKDSIKLFDNTGKEISSDSEPQLVAPNQIELKLSKLEPSIYIVNWNVVSKDSHPISGTYTFTVGEPIAEKSTIDPVVFENIVLLSDENIHKVPANINRWILFITTATTIAICLLFFFGTIKIPTRSRFKILVVPTSLGILTTLASIFIQNATIDNKSIASSISIRSFVDQLQYDFGIAATIRIAAFIALFISLINIKIFKILAPILSIVLIGTITFSGHSASGAYSVLSIPMSLIHVGATSIWFGGLILALTSIKFKELQFDFQKFSKIALLSVVATVLTGIFATWRQVGNINYARNSEFGQTLSYKIALVLITIAVAFFTRKLLKDNRRMAMRKLIAVEVALMVGILAFTSVLVSEIPSKTSAEIPVTVKTKTENGILEVSADPAKSGLTEIHVYVYDDKGLPLQIEAKSLSDPPIQVTIQNEEKEIGPISVAMRFQGLNHFNSVGLRVPFSGEWKITVRVQLNDFDEIAEQVEIKYL
jgi:copper transport protein